MTEDLDSAARCRKHLICSTVEHGPTHRDASITQFGTPFFAPLLVMFMSHMLLCGINHMDELQVRSHLGWQNGQQNRKYCQECRVSS